MASLDCRYKTPEQECSRMKGGCKPGERGCVLHGRFYFPLKEKAEQKARERDKRS